MRVSRSYNPGSRSAAGTTIAGPGADFTAVVWPKFHVRGSHLSAAAEGSVNGDQFAVGVSGAVGSWDLPRPGALRVAARAATLGVPGFLHWRGSREKEHVRRCHCLASEPWSVETTICHVLGQASSKLTQAGVQTKRHNKNATTKNVCDSRNVARVGERHAKWQDIFLSFTEEPVTFLCV